MFLFGLILPFHFIYLFFWAVPPSQITVYIVHLVNKEILIFTPLCQFWKQMGSIKMQHYTVFGVVP